MKKLLIGLIHFYQKIISPMLKYLFGVQCRFYPTCSEYAVLAIEKYGVFRGGLKAVKRLARCNPFCEGGIDYP